MAKHRPLRVNTETALELADELGNLLAKQGISCRNIRERID